MFLDGYVIIKYYGIGIKLLSINKDYIYQQIFFEKKENAKKYIEKIKANFEQGLELYHAKIYVSNKVIYEKNDNFIDNTNIDQFSLI